MESDIKLTCANSRYTQLPDGAVANVSAFGYLSGNPINKRPEAATAHTGERWWQALRVHIN